MIEKLKEEPNINSCGLIPKLKQPGLNCLKQEPKIKLLSLIQEPERDLPLMKALLMLNLYKPLLKKLLEVMLDLLELKMNYLNLLLEKNEPSQES